MKRTTIERHPIWFARQMNQMTFRIESDCYCFFTHLDMSQVIQKNANDFLYKWKFIEFVSLTHSLSRSLKKKIASIIWSLLLCVFDSVNFIVWLRNVKSCKNCLKQQMMFSFKIFSMTSVRMVKGRTDNYNSCICDKSKFMRHFSNEGLLNKFFAWCFNFQMLFVHLRYIFRSFKKCFPICASI